MQLDSLDSGEALICNKFCVCQALGFVIVGFGKIL
jgi:hypothetical protein